MKPMRLRSCFSALGERQAETAVFNSLGLRPSARHAAETFKRRRKEGLV